MNNNMNLNDIFTTMADISNSLWNLRKQGDLSAMDDSEFTQMYETATEFYSELGWVISLQNVLGNVVYEDHSKAE